MRALLLLIVAALAIAYSIGALDAVGALDVPDKGSGKRSRRATKQGGSPHPETAQNA